MTDKGKDKMTLSEAEWREKLTDDEFAICRLKATEPAFTGEYCDTKTLGTYLCAACGQELFSSDTKFESRSGWPSFTQPTGDSQIINETDQSHGMVRTEVMCSRCSSHLGHVFPDGPEPTGLRYCINSISLKLKPEE